MITMTETMQKTWKYLISAGLTPAGTAGMMGNLYAESGIIPNRVEILCLKRLKEVGKIYTDATYTAFVDDGTISRAEFLHPLPGRQYGYGLCQWTSPSRKEGLYDLCKSRKVSIGDLTTQLEYLVKELKGSYHTIWQLLTTTTDIAAASDRVLTGYECPADTSAAVKKTRQSYAREFYQAYAKGGTKMHYISNCGSDERGSYTGGQAGDQTGKEWALIAWYSRPWNCVLRHPDPVIRQYHASMAAAAAKNNKIGYDQGQRDTFGVQLKAAGDDPAKITVACETDCSKGIIDITKAIGRKTGRTELQNIQATYTGNMRSAYQAAGYQVLTANKYLTGPDYLLPGDILLNDQHHTATNITAGSKSGATIEQAQIEQADTKATAAVKEAVEAAAVNKGDQNVTLKWFLKGAVDPQIAKIQLILRHHGYKGKNGLPLEVDGELGVQTMYAIETLQREKGFPGTTNWGTIAAKTWQAILNL